MIPAQVLLDAIAKALKPFGDIIGEWEVGADPITQDRFAYTLKVTMIERADGPQAAGPDDGHAVAVGQVGGPIEPAVLCWAASAAGRCALTLDVIDLVCPEHGKRRPPRDGS